MKTLILIVALLGTGYVASFAQAEQATTTQGDTANTFHPVMTPEQLAEKRTKLYEKRLGLNSVQYKNFYAIELDYWQQYQKIKKSIANPEPEQMQRLNDDMNAEIKKILTPVQVQKFEAMIPNPPKPTDKQ